MTLLKIFTSPDAPNLDTFPFLESQEVERRDSSTIIIDLGQISDTSLAQEQWLDSNPDVLAYVVKNKEAEQPDSIDLWLMGRIAEWKITPDQLACELGVHITTVYSWLTGQRRPNKANRTLLARTFGKTDLLEPVYSSLLLPYETMAVRCQEKVCACCRKRTATRYLRDAQNLIGDVLVPFCDVCADYALTKWEETDVQI